MRKTVIALLLVLPLLFIFVVFSTTNTASLGVNIPVNKIMIANKSDFDNGSIKVDLLNKERYFLEVVVEPQNATNKEYTFETEKIGGADLAEVYVDPVTGEINVYSAGAARICVVSKDGNQKDSIELFAEYSAPYDFGFTLTGSSGDVKLTEKDGDYSATVDPGIYLYGIDIKPGGFSESRLEISGGDAVAEIDAGNREILLPFSGKVQLKAVVPGGPQGDIVKNVTLNVRKRSSRTGITVNGQTDGASVLLESGARSASFYLETASESQSDPQITLDGNDAAVKSLTPSGKNRYKAEIDILGKFSDGESFAAVVSDDAGSETVTFTFADFDFNLRSNLNFAEKDGVFGAYVRRKTATTFYAVSVVPSGEVVYEWKAEGAEGNTVSPSGDGKSCTVTCNGSGAFTLSAAAIKNGDTIAEKKITLTPVNSVNSIDITNDTNADLAAIYTIGGKKYENDRITDNKYYVNAVPYNIGGEAPDKGLSDLDFGVSDDSVAKAGLEDGKIFIEPVGTGEVTLTVEWKGNYSYGASTRRYLTLNVVKDAVEVSTAQQLTRAAEDHIIVLTADISLGVRDDGSVMSAEERNAVLKSHEMRSTYNTEWYRESGRQSEAVVHYVQEFRHDVYGNGHTLDADKYTRAVDGTGINPALSNYIEPLYFVCYNNVATVAGQDNCAFLIRTDGVKLYGVNLYGCKDSSLYNDGVYDLNLLNGTGTTLEINASASVVNCRIRNGRNVVRVYGGNRNGDSYFIDSLKDNPGCGGERIYVNISGCIISHGREFLLKAGANRALRASSRNGAAPELTNEYGNAYSPSGRPGSNVYDLTDDEYFYDKYVMTDITLCDSVLETSGLFSVGVESNFSGDWLYENSHAEGMYGTLTQTWRKSGGTSFAAVLRLKGDVRIYDWKDISHVDSSTLIESPINSLNDWLKLNISAMFDFVSSTSPDIYGNLTYNRDGTKYVHGGIAFYGGGRNYSQLSLEELDENLADLSRYCINIGILASSPDPKLQRQGSMLPNAAGTNDFRFYVYGSDSANGYEEQLRAERDGTKYNGVAPLMPGGI